jgi:presenilin-like A22 family membrane protease
MTDSSSGQLPWFYKPGVQQIVLVGLLAVGILVPALFEEFLDPVIIGVLFVVPTGVYFVKNGERAPIAPWVILTATSLFLIIYGGYVVGITLSPIYAVGFALAVLVYDIVGVQTGKMQSMNSAMLTNGIPVVLLLPHTPAFEYETFKSIIETEGLDGLHGSDQGVMMLGIGDPIIPAAIAVSCASLGTVYSLGPIGVTLPQVSAGIGGLLGLAVLPAIELPRAIAALTASVPGALLGLAIGVLIDPSATILAF